MKTKTAIPPLRDARYLQIAVLLLYAIVAREYFHFDRSHLTTLACCLWAIGLDFILSKTLFKKTHFPLSPLIIGLSSSLLIYSHYTLAYLLVVTVAILSKALVRYKERHIFNPTNLGVVVVLTLFPSYAIGYPILFYKTIEPSMLIGVFGLITSIVAGQILVSASFLFGFSFFALVRAHFVLSNASLFPMLGPGFLLYTFHMINDPSTVPKKYPFKILFGFIVALVDSIFRFSKVPNGLFYSLAITSCMLPWIRDYEALNKKGFKFSLSRFKLSAG